MHMQCMLKMSRVYTLTEILSKIFVKNRGVKFPNKLLALHVPKFSMRCCKLESTTQIVKTFTRPAYFPCKCEWASGILHP